MKKKPGGNCIAAPDDCVGCCGCSELTLLRMSWTMASMFGTRFMLNADPWAAPPLLTGKNADPGEFCIAASFKERELPGKDPRNP